MDYTLTFVALLAACIGLCLGMSLQWRRNQRYIAKLEQHIVDLLEGDDDDDDWGADDESQLIVDEHLVQPQPANDQALLRHSGSLD